MSLVVKLPWSTLSGTTSAAAVYVHADMQYDYAIAGLPFLSAVDPQHPTIRKTAPYQKPRNDNSLEPGEQSLGFWWLKAQSTFHGGAGQLYIDTPVVQGAEVRQLRYQSSAGVDVWTKGRVSLLPTTSQAATVSGSKPLVKAVSYGGVNYLLYTDGGALWRVTETITSGVPSYSTPTSVNWGGTLTIQSLAVDGRYYYVTDGLNIYKGDISAPATAATNMYVLTTTTPGTAVLAYTKLRLMLGFTNPNGTPSSSVYELNSNSTGGAALPTAKYVHPNPTWVWTSFGDGPSAIYASGYVGNYSTVFKFVLDTSGSVPTLTSAITVDDLPPGEVCYQVYGYLGTSIVLATNKGVRVGQFGGGATGDFQCGPLSLNTASASGAVIGRDRFIYGAYTDSAGVAGLARIDTSSQLSIRPFSYVPDQLFSWAPDIRATDNSESFISGTTTAVDLVDGTRPVFAVAGKGIYVQHPTYYTPTGSLTTSRIRYETLDPKLIRYVRIRAEGTYGIVGAAVNQNADSGAASDVTINLQSQQDSGDAAVNLPPLNYATVTISLTRDATHKDQTPTSLGYQLKALPAQKRQRFIQLPLKCFDVESDSTGGTVGQDGYALSRLLQLERIEENGDLVTLQILSPYLDNTYTATCVIEDIEFQQTSTATETQGWGGILTVTLRTVT